MGDFNEVLSPDERRGGSVITQGMRELQHLVQDLQLVDMQIDQKFTWIRKNAASRIDRLLIDKDLALILPNSKEFCRDRMLSDHFPIVFSSSAIKWSPPPFRSLDCWLEEPSFEKMFRSCWLKLQGMPLGKKLQLMKHPIKAWNKQVFGHIDHKLRVLQDAIAKLEKEAQNRQLEEHEWSRMDALKSQLGLWMIRKERYWK